MADQISDAILDAIILQDPWGKVACECLVKTGATIVAGEISTHAAVDIEKIVRNTIKRLVTTIRDWGLMAIPAVY